MYMLVHEYSISKSICIRLELVAFVRGELDGWEIKGMKEVYVLCILLYFLNFIICACVNHSKIVKYF